MELGLEDVAVLVTGGSKGIGLACARNVVGTGGKQASPIHLPGGAANAAHRALAVVV